MERLLRRLASLAVRLYYRVETLGGEVPAAGPVLLVGNHPNGLVDPVVLAGTTSRPVRFLGKAPLFDLPLLGRVMRGLRVLPVYRPQDGADTARNEETFAAVHAALGAGDLVCVFPEGTSHSEPELRRLKTGTARMALGAEAHGGSSLGVRILPVGLVYRRKSRFRSRAASWVGEPIEVRDLAAQYRADEVATVRALTERIAEGLRDVTLNLDRWEDLPLLELAARIWREGDDSAVERTKRFADGVRVLRQRDPRRIDALAFRISCFRARLEYLGLDVDDLDLRYTPGGVLRFTLVTLRDLVLRLPLALVGGVYWYVPYRLTGLLGRRFTKGEDLAATTHLLAACVLFPAWLVLTNLVVFWLWGAGPALVGLVLLPPLGPLAAGFVEWAGRVAGDVSTFLRLGQRRRLRELLARQRDELAAEIETLAEVVRSTPPAATSLSS